jgi:antitoxin HicB
MRRYTIILEYDPETESYGVKVPALPGCFSMGQTVDEAVAHAREAIELYIEDLKESGEPIPEDVAPIQVLVIDAAA